MGGDMKNLLKFIAVFGLAGCTSSATPPSVEVDVNDTKGTAASAGVVEALSSTGSLPGFQHRLEHSRMGLGQTSSATNAHGDVTVTGDQGAFTTDGNTGMVIATSLPTSTFAALGKFPGSQAHTDAVRDYLVSAGVAGRSNRRD